jgi:hypothetical protein
MHSRIDTIVDHLGESIQYIQNSVLCRACRQREPSQIVAGSSGEALDLNLAPG